MAGVGLALELVERFFDLVGQVEQELGLSLDLGERSLQLDRGEPCRIGRREPVGRPERVRSRRRQRVPGPFERPVF